MSKKEPREYIIAEKPNGLGRSVIPYGATYKQDPEYMYIRVIEKQAYDELQAQLEIAKDALEEIEHGEEYDPLDEKHWYMDRNDMQVKAQQALTELKTTGE